MVGYVSTIIERQDRYDINKKMQSFEVESAARKALDDLVSHFHMMNDRTLEKIDDVRSVAKYAKQHTLEQATLVRKLQI
jgi:hypothetical protein